MTKTINEHQGRKYVRRIYSVTDQTELLPGVNKAGIDVDVYAVLVAFGVTCPATAHAIKKLLCLGQRGRGGRLEDLIGAEAAVSRAIELERLILLTNPVKVEKFSRSCEVGAEEPTTTSPPAPEQPASSEVKQKEPEPEVTPEMLIKGLLTKKEWEELKKKYEGQKNQT